MKVSTLVTAGIATMAAAAPIRVVMISRIPIRPGQGHDMGHEMGKFGNIDEALSAIHVGHAGSKAAGWTGEYPVPDIHFLPPAPLEDGPQRNGPGARRGGCGRMRNKFMQISEGLKKALGMPTLMRGEHPHHGNVGAAIPVHRDGAVRILPYPHFGEPAVRLVKVDPSIGQPIPIFMPVRVRQDSFVHRLNRAVGQLGTWEARAMSFVLGCGIGVLLRMFFVFALLLARGSRSSRRIQLPTEEPATPVIVVLPTTYPSDEKDASAFLPEYPVDVKVVEQVVVEAPRA